MRGIRCRIRLDVRNPIVRIMDIARMNTGLAQAVMRCYAETP